MGHSGELFCAFIYSFNKYGFFLRKGNFLFVWKKEHQSGLNEILLKGETEEQVIYDLRSLWFVGYYLAYQRPKHVHWNDCELYTNDL